MNPILEMELDFDDELENEIEDIDVYRSIDTVSERFRIKDLNSANWAFRKLKAIEEKKKEIEELAEKEIEAYQLEIAKIIEWKDSEFKSYGSSIYFFNFLLEEYYREQIKLDPKFKLSTPHGKISSRKQQDKWIFKDETVLTSLKQYHLDKFIRVKEEVNKADLKQEVNVIEYESGYVCACDGVVIGEVRPNDEDGIEYVNVETGEIYNTQEHFYDIFEQVIAYDGKIINGIKVEPQPDSISIKVEV